MPEPTIRRLLEEATHPLLSFEFFPPKDDSGLERLHKTAAALLDAGPDFVTVTYGAGGSTQQTSIDVCRMMKEAGFGTVMPHLTCVGASRSELHEVIDRLYLEGYRNIMTLRGDPPRDETIFKLHPDGLPFARDLVEHILHRYPDICCGVAGYPEVHPEALSAEDDVLNVKRKLDAGGTFVTTQLFYDNAHFYAFVDRCRAAGISAPIIPGLLPPVSLQQVGRITRMCGSSLPDALARQLEAAGDDKAAAVQAGIQWVAHQVEDLLRNGVPGIHLYILNREKSGLAPEIVDPILGLRT
jgi:methylenetetrahydrofolate reductase (NADPH)